MSSRIFQSIILQMKDAAAAGDTAEAIAAAVREMVYPGTV